MNLDGEPVKLADGLEFCEGPAFGSDGCLYCVNLRGGYVSRITRSGEAYHWVDTGAPNGGQFDANGNYLVCEFGRKSIMAIAPDGTVTTVVDHCCGERFKGPNDLAVDADGGFYFTDPEGSSLEHPIGHVYYIRPDRTVVPVARGLAYPNGINITVDRSAVLVSETLTQQIHRYERQADGMFGRREVFCRLEGPIGPDGMCLDRDGNLYVAHFGQACIQVIAPSGMPLGRLSTPGDNPTNCCFGPPGTDWATHLFVTETATNAVYHYDVGIAGMPLHHLAVASD